MNRIPPAAAIRAYEQSFVPTPTALPHDEAQAIAAQYLSLDDYGRRVAKAFMASLVRLGKGAA